MKDREERLGQLLRELREEELAAAPRFRRMWRHAAEGRRSRSGPRIARFAALALVLVAAVVVLRRVTPPVSPDVDAATELAEALSGWEAPLDFLLELPGSGMPVDEPIPPGSARQLLEMIENDLSESGEAG